MHRIFRPLAFALAFFLSILSLPVIPAAGDVASRQADPSTLDGYRTVLDLSQDTRAAGRLWTDKSVFASGQGDQGDRTKDWDGSVLTLSEELDGIIGSVAGDSDFLEVYSALGSSLAINQYPACPIDLVISIDMSASMGEDIRYALDGISRTNFELNADQENYDILKRESNYEKQDIARRTMTERIANSRIQQTLNAVNATIESLMTQNRNNRVAVILYGAGATAIMPLAHYEKIGETPYLTVSSMEPNYDMRELVWNNALGEWVWNKNRDTLYTVTANARYSFDCSQDFVFAEDEFAYQEEGDVSGTLLWTVSNDVKNSKTRASVPYQNWKNDVFSLFQAVKSDLAEPEMAPADKHIGYLTNVQGGIYLSYAQLAKTDVTTYTENDITVPRVPAAIITSDGGANFAFNDMTHWDSYGVYKTDPGAENLELFENGNSDFAADNNGTYDPEDHSHRLGENEGDEWYAVYLPGLNDQNEITSLYNSAWYADSGYNLLKSVPGWYHAGVLYSSNTDIFGTSGANLEVLLTAAYMKSATAKHYTSGWDAGKISQEDRHEIQTYTMCIDSGGLPQWQKMRLYPTMDPKNYSLNKTNWWNEEDDAGNRKFGPNDLGYGSFDLNAVMNGMIASWEQWKSGAMTSANANSPTVKINIKPLKEGHYDETFGVAISNQDVIENIEYSDKFYDGLSSDVGIVFDEILSQITSPVMTPITGENDLEVNDSVTFRDPIGEYLEVKDVKNLALFGKLYEMTKTAVYSYEFEQSAVFSQNGEGWYKEEGDAFVYGGNGLLPNAWEDGWNYFVNAKTASMYVPSIKDIEDGSPVHERMKQTLYQFFRVNEDAQERDKLYRNPAYGDQEDLAEDYLGVYRLNDLRVWTEKTNGREELWINIPKYMLPLWTVTITENRDDNSYVTNQSAFPLRVFYTVGMESDILSDGEIDFKKVEREYIDAHKVKTDEDEAKRALAKGSVEFFSNYYGANHWEAYSGENSYGDPVATFSPHKNNRYYIFQNPIPLYQSAYQYDGGKWVSGEFEGKIAGFDDREGTFQSGDIVLEDLVKTEVEGDRAYFLPIDFYELGETAIPVWHSVLRKGSEFGAVYSDNIAESDLLCWYDLSGENHNLYPYAADASHGRDYIGAVLNSDGTYADQSDNGFPAVKTNAAGEAPGNWVVAVKPGGIRVGTMDKYVSDKGGEYDTYGFRSGNITRTANNSYLPAISERSEPGAVIVNVYQGNNGRFFAPDPTGDLVVSKKVVGGDGEFWFDVTLSDVTVNGTFGDMTFTDGKAEFSLKNGESKTAAGLPAGITYTVAEREAHGYSVSATGDTGTISEGQVAKADFVNHKDLLLPNTGGSGTDKLVIVSFSLLLAGAYIFRKRGSFL